MKLILKPAKPRNPLVVPGRPRAAGAHRRRHERQAAQRALRTELEQLRPSP